MSKFTNDLDIPLGLAVWLVNDNYDYQAIPNYISATSLMKPVRQIVLGARDKEAIREDLVDLIPRALGNSIHDSVENAWVRNKEANLRSLGYPDSVIEKVKVNPKKDELTDSCIPIYIEQRTTKKIGKYTIGGKFDMCIEGVIHDIKSTSAYAWVFGTNDEDYKLQGSIYRFLNPDIIKSDFIRIMFVFTDWQKSRVGTENYPNSRVLYKDIPLMSIKETERWIRDKLAKVDTFKDSEESEIPYCTPEELWLNEPKHRYYKDPNKTTRATRVFDTMFEAEAYKAETGKGVGIIISEKLEPKRCGYCPAYSICSQKDIYFND